MSIRQCRSGITHTGDKISDEKYRRGTKCFNIISLRRGKCKQILIIRQKYYFNTDKGRVLVDFLQAVNIYCYQSTDFRTFIFSYYLFDEYWRGSI